MEKINIPVVLFTFRRSNTIPAIMERIATAKPPKIYLLSDEGRNAAEKEEVKKCREIVEKSISWDCEVIKHYANSNRGVYKNIGEGARWVFEREEMAIFLEDDNLPEVTFFKYCEELLKKYSSSEKILWICGTNYLGQYDSQYSYMFTKNLLPCGWASWANKFLKYYDGELNGYTDADKQKRFCQSYNKKSLYKQQLRLIDNEYKRREKGFLSWDYQMLFSVRANDMYGISPVYNQIKNIGVDEYSIHGGTSNKNVMTDRFCGVPTSPLDFPLKHPNDIYIDLKYERLIDNIILDPLKTRIRKQVGRIIRKLIGLDDTIPLRSTLKRKNDEV